MDNFLKEIFKKNSMIIDKMSKTSNKNRSWVRVKIEANP